MFFFSSLSVNDQEKLYVDPVTDFFDYGNFSELNAANPWEGRGKMAPFDQKVRILSNGIIPFIPEVNRVYWVISKFFYILRIVKKYQRRLRVICALSTNGRNNMCGR